MHGYLNAFLNHEYSNRQLLMVVSEHEVVYLCDMNYFQHVTSTIFMFFQELLDFSFVEKFWFNNFFNHSIHFYGNINSLKVVINHDHTEKDIVCQNITCNTITGSKIPTPSLSPIAYVPCSKYCEQTL